MDDQLVIGGTVGAVEAYLQRRRQEIRREDRRLAELQEQMGHLRGSAARLAGGTYLTGGTR